MTTTADAVMDVVLSNPVTAHAAFTSGYAIAKNLTLAGRRVRLLVQEHDDDRTLQQNKFYWGPCLGEIAEQASINGQKWADVAWHELFKRMFLGYQIRKIKVAGRKRVTVIRSLRSTTGLKVKPMGVYLDKLQAFAATDLGVEFSVREWREFDA